MSKLRAQCFTISVDGYGAGPVLGSGEHLLTGLDLLALGYQVEEHATSEAAMHVVHRRSSKA